MIVEIFLFLIGAVVFVFLIKTFKKANSEFNEKRKTFVKYVESINDMETLKHIGEINMFGDRERWYPNYLNLVFYMKKKIEQTNDEHFKWYLTEYKIFMKKYLCTMPFIFLIPMIFLGYIMKHFHWDSIGLGHELIHALHNANGENKAGEKVFSYTNLIGIKMNYTENWQSSVEELRTVGISNYCNNNDITENKLRAEQNYHLRAEY